LLIIGLFIGALLEANIVIVIELLFAGSLVSLISSLVVFMLDINLSLRALRLELNSHKLLD
jgi:hypothetical protein